MNDEFTLEDLKQFDGQNGHKAYVAVNRKVYDVTNSKEWNEGQHHGNSAGRDLSDAIKFSPHGTGMLKKVPMVGRLVK